MSNLVQEFNDYRSKMNEKLLADNNKVIKRIFNVDTNAYMEGALDVKTKELVKTWQEDKGLKADGLWGKESQRFLITNPDEKENESDID